MGTPDGDTNFLLWKDSGPKIINSSYHTNKFDTSKFSTMQIMSSQHTKLTYSTGSNTYFGMSAVKSYYIDKKIDDGVANKGDVFTDVTVDYVDNEGDCGTASTYDTITNSDCFLFYDFPSLRGGF